MNRSLRVVLIALATVLSLSGQGVITPGKVTERIQTSADPSQSYAIYLPTGYDEKRQYPAIYAFDPGGRGVSGVLAYQKAAEKLGYIVIGSNNSRNGMDGGTLTAAVTALWRDTHERFSIDDKRVVATGFSGGARVASSFAAACKCFFGVIGSGASFSRDVTPDKALPFVFVGTVGVDDFNYPELRDLQAKLRSSGVASRLLTFDGGHQWPPEPIAEAALGSVELRAMKAGVKSKDDTLIDAIAKTDERRGDALLAAKDYLAADDEYSSAIDELSELRDASVVKSKLASLEASPEYKLAIKADRDARARQMQVLGETSQLEQGLFNMDTRVESLDKIRARIGTLRAHFDDVMDSPERRLARRVLNSIFIGAYEAVTLRYEPAKNYEMALVELEFAALVRPDSREVPYQQARIYALKGDKKRALQSLTRAVTVGFRDAKRLSSDTAFDRMRTDPEFTKIAAGLAGN